MKATFVRTMKRAVGAGLICAAVTAPVLAQPNAELYGLITVWTGAQRLPGGHNSWQVSGGGMSTSYLGVKGDDDFGGGYKGVFALEAFFRPEDGAYGRFEGDTFFARAAYIGLESPYGTVTAGRVTTSLFVSTILFNPFADSYVFSPMIYHTYLGLGTFPSYVTDQGAVGDSGWSNAVQYATPSVGGLTGALTYGVGNSAQDNGAKKWSAQFLYANGPFAATGVYQYTNFSTKPSDLGQLVPGMTSQRVGQLGISYDLRYAKFFGQYMYTDNQGVQTNWRVNTGQVGVSVPAGKGSVMASYAYSRDSAGLRQTRLTWALGYDYPITKRVDVYAAYLNDQISDQSGGYTLGAGARFKF
jgi:predicted porin